MPIPLIVIIPAIVGLTGAGAGLGCKGASDLRKANKTAKRARKDLKHAVRDYSTAEERVSRRLERYAEFQLDIQAETLGRWLTWLEANERKVRRLEHKVIDEIDVVVPDLPGLRSLVEPAELLKGTVGSVVAGVVMRQGAITAVRGLASAGTGAAIGGLSGAAAENALLAWLGGGTLAAGGGGVAAGGLVLTGIGVAPAALLTGASLAIQGDKAKTKAKKYAAEVKVEVRRLSFQVKLFKRIRKQVKERAQIVEELNALALAALCDLEALQFNPATHVRQFQKVALLMAAISEILRTPVIEDDPESGDLTVVDLKLPERTAA